MFRPKTLLVLGAGASFDLGFPLGAELRQQITELFSVHYPQASGEIQVSYKDEQQHFFKAFRAETKIDTIEALRIARQISEGLPFSSSIDNFLEMRKADSNVVSCAKAAILHIIARREAAQLSLTQTDLLGTPLIRRFENTWLQPFSEICFSGAGPADLDDALSRLSAVSFNYDRSFSRFICVAISKLYGIDWCNACEISRGLCVSYPYGSLGPLPLVTDIPFGVDFGAAYGRDARLKTDSIRTFTEGGRETKSLEKIRQQVAEANHIIFLGFGYHRQNMDLLGSEPSDQGRLVLGTALGVAQAARDNLQSSIARQFGQKRDGRLAKVHLEPKTAAQLLEEYRHLLTA